MRTPEFEAYIAPARLYPQIWRILLSLMLMGFIYAGFMGLVFWFGFAMDPFKFLSWANAVANAFGPIPTLIMLTTFIGMALGPIVAVAACHGRSPATLFGPLSDTLRGFLTALITAAILYAIYQIAILIFITSAVNLPLDEWLKYLPIALVLLLIQTSAEELLFRGYLQQQLAARFHSPLIWMVLPSAIFAALHWDASLGHNVWLVLTITFAVGMIAADLTRRTGSLGAAIGLHFANNIFAMLLLSIKGTVTGLALLITPFDKADTTTLPLILGADLLVLLIIWRILRILLDR